MKVLRIVQNVLFSSIKLSDGDLNQKMFIQVIGGTLKIVHFVIECFMQSQNDILAT